MHLTIEWSPAVIVWLDYFVSLLTWLLKGYLESLFKWDKSGLMLTLSRCVRAHVCPVSSEAMWRVSEKEMKWSHCCALLKAGSRATADDPSLPPRLANYSKSRRSGAHAGPHAASCWDSGLNGIRNQTAGPRRSRAPFKMATTRGTVAQHATQELAEQAELDDRTILQLPESWLRPTCSIFITHNQHYVRQGSR